MKKLNPEYVTTSSSLEGSTAKNALGCDFLFESEEEEEEAISISIRKTLTSLSILSRLGLSDGSGRRLLVIKLPIVAVVSPRLSIHKPLK
jgi:hypothetical protein